MSGTIDLFHLRSWIGREETASDIISIDLVRRFEASFDRPERVPVAGNTAPLLIGYCLAQPAAPTKSLGEDGHPARGGFHPPVPLPRRMWASSNLTFHGDMRVGDEVQRVSRIADVTLKEGRSGALCFVTVQHRLTVSGVPKVDEVQTLVYREAATSGEPANAATTEAAPAGGHSRPAIISAPLLFRYSALTFNGHRIHYDRSYASQVELYPGLVVHGPLQATLLLNLAAELRGAAPTSFSFRGMSPLFDHDTIDLHAAEEGGRMLLWTARRGGAIGMRAEAAW